MQHSALNVQCPYRREANKSGYCKEQEHLVHLACFMPFDKVAEMMEELLSVQTTEETVRRHTEQAGAWMEDWQTAEVEAEASPESERERPLERCVFSPDG